MEPKTKYILTFLGGLVAGVFLTFAVCLAIASNASGGNNDPGIELFERPTKEIKVKSFEVFQVLRNGNALARVDDYHGEVDHGTIVLFLADKDHSYYDDQKIIVPKNGRAMQIGTYRYTTSMDVSKTVPIVKFYQK